MNLLDTLLLSIIYCDVDDFRYFGLEFLNRCVDHSEGLSHSLFLLLPSLLFFEQFCFRISYLPVDSRRVYWGIIKCATVSQIFIVEYCWNKWRIFWTIWYTLIIYIEEYCIAYLGNMCGQFDADDDYLYSKHMLDVWPLWLELQLQHRRILVSMCSLFQFKWWYHTYLHCLNIRCGQYLNDLMSWLRCRVFLSPSFSLCVCAAFGCEHVKLHLFRRLLWFLKICLHPKVYYCCVLILQTTVALMISDISD